MPDQKPDHAAALEWAQSRFWHSGEASYDVPEDHQNAARCILDLHAQLKQALKDLAVMDAANKDIHNLVRDITVKAVEDKHLALDRAEKAEAESKSLREAIEAAHLALDGRMSAEYADIKHARNDTFIPPAAPNDTNAPESSIAPEDLAQARIWAQSELDAFAYTMEDWTAVNKNARRVLLKLLEERKS